MSVNPCPGGFQGAFGTGRTRYIEIQINPFYLESQFYFCCIRALNREQYFTAPNPKTMTKEEAVPACVSSMCVKSVERFKVLIWKGVFWPFWVDFGHFWASFFPFSRFLDF
jgi:hypothetical protein